MIRMGRESVRVEHVKVKVKMFRGKRRCGGVDLKVGGSVRIYTHRDSLYSLWCISQWYFTSLV